MNCEVRTARGTRTKFMGKLCTPGNAKCWIQIIGSNCPGFLEFVPDPGALRKLSRKSAKFKHIYVATLLGAPTLAAEQWCHLTYRRLWLFSAPRQLGAYYYISAYIITVTRTGLLSACVLNQMLRLELWEVTIGTRNRTLSLLWPKQH